MELRRQCSYWQTWSLGYQTMPKTILIPKISPFFLNSSLNEDTEIAFDQLKSNLIEKLLNPQLA